MSSLSMNLSVAHHRLKIITMVTLDLVYLVVPWQLLVTSQYRKGVHLFGFWFSFFRWRLKFGTWGEKQKKKNNNQKSFHESRLISDMHLINVEDFSFYKKKKERKETQASGGGGVSTIIPKAKCSLGCSVVIERCAEWLADIKSNLC